jgi:hypothetical protein
MLAILFIILYIMLYLTLCNKVTRTWWWVKEANMGRRIVIGMVSIPLCLLPIFSLAIVVFFNLKGTGKVAPGHELLPQETIGSAIQILPAAMFLGILLVWVFGE